MADGDEFLLKPCPGRSAHRGPSRNGHGHHGPSPLVRPTEVQMSRENLLKSQGKWSSILNPRLWNGWIGLDYRNDLSKSNGTAVWLNNFTQLS